MKKKLLASSMLVAGVCMFQNVAYANPYVFQFTESYDTNTNAAVFGTAANIKVTLDNGGASTISQAYTWNDIIGVSVQAVGGTFADSWTSIFRGTDTNVFLTTDVSGLIGTLSFGPSWADEYITSPSTFTLGSRNQLGSGGYEALALTFSLTHSGAEIFHDITTTATLVPEPETYAMMLAGLGLLGVAVRRRKQNSVA